MTNLKTKTKNLGGYRPNAGRPKGSTSKISASSLLAQIELDNSGLSYEELLVNDFMTARASGDANLILKYHSMILNKVMSSLSTIEVEDTANSIEAKQIAFMAALNKLVGHSE